MRAFLLSFGLGIVAACGNAGGGGIQPSMPVVVEEGRAPVAYGSIISDMQTLRPDSLPAEFETVRTGSSCRTPKARSGAKVAYVYSYGGRVPTPLHHINRKDTEQDIDARRELVRKRKENARTAVEREALGMAIGNAVQNARRLDVLVTETEGPVFLYLTSYDSVLWNIQRAPGVEIDGIVVNSYQAGAIANGVKANRTGMVSFNNAPTRECYVSAPGRPIPVEERIASASKLNPNFDPSRYRKQWQQEYRDTKRFYSQTMRKLAGRPAAWILNDARGEQFNAVLVGPAPAEPFKAQPISRLQIPFHITPYWGGRKDAYKTFGLNPSS